MRRLAATLAALLALSSVLCATQGGQDSPFRIQVGVDLVSVNFSATDSKGRFIPGLTQKDFTVEEDGKVQNLTAFSHSNAERRARARQLTIGRGFRQIPASAR